MNSHQLLVHRLLNQQIATTSFAAPGDMVRWLGAMQAQDYAGALWSIGLRLPGVTQQDVEAAIASKQIVRTWPMRGTLHFVAPEDVRWMLRLMTPRIIATSARRHAQLDLDDKTFAKSFELLAKSLQGGKRLMRRELMEIFERNGLSTAGQRGYHMLWRAAQEGLICLGPMNGKQQTFVLLDEWIPNGKNLDREAALAEIATRYFASHAPATLKDFMWWTGLPAREAREAFELIKRHLHAVFVEGREYWAMHNWGDTDATVAYVELMPGFDEYMLGYTDRSAIIGDKEKYMPPLNGVFPATVLIDGQVMGTWRRAIKAKQVEIELQPFGKFSSTDADVLEIAARRYGQFIGKPAKIVA